MMQTVQVSEDHCCSICLSVFYKPVRLRKCGHLFCRVCLEEATQLTDLKACPLCRKRFRSLEMLDQLELEQKMQELYPEQLKEKIANIKEKIYYRLEIGNTTEVIQSPDGNNYIWELFIQPASGEKQLTHFMHSIEVQLHPTFNPSKIRFNLSKPVLLKRWGWGTFRIGIKINWKNQFGGHTELHHDLKFIPRAASVITCKIEPK